MINILKDCFIQQVIIVILLFLSAFLAAYSIHQNTRKNEWKQRAQNLEKDEPWVGEMEVDEHEVVNR